MSITTNCLIKNLSYSPKNGNGYQAHLLVGGGNLITAVWSVETPAEETR